MNDAPRESDKSDPYAASVTRPPLWRMLLRGAGRRCPWCGQRGAYFTGWFAKEDHCPGCGLRWRRGDVGFELGAATMSAIFTLGTIVVLMGIGLVAMWPDRSAKCRTLSSSVLMPSLFGPPTAKQSSPRFAKHTVQAFRLS